MAKKKPAPVNEEPKKIDTADDERAKVLCKIRDDGWKVVDEQGVLIFLVNSDQYEEEKDQVRQRMQEHGWTGSYGVRKAG